MVKGGVGEPNEESPHNHAFCVLQLTIDSIYNGVHQTSLS